MSGSGMVAKPALQWAALRALHEGAAARLELLAEASGRSLSLMRKRSVREGWRDAEVAMRLSGQERRLRALLNRQRLGGQGAHGRDFRSDADTRENWRSHAQRRRREREPNEKR